MDARMQFAIQFAIWMAIRMMGQVDLPSGWQVGACMTIQMAILDGKAVPHHPFWPSQMTRLCLIIWVSNLG